jgi:hypothetical protein
MMAAPHTDQRSRAGQPTTTGGHLPFGEVDPSRSCSPFHNLEVAMSTHEDRFCEVCIAIAAVWLIVWILLGVL